MGLNEMFWKRMRFALLFILTASLIFIVITKFIFKIPILESRDLLESINDSEEIFEIQEEYITKVKGIHDKIEKIPFDVNQIQVVDEIDKEIYLLRDIYKKNNMNNKFLFGLQSSRVLKIFFDLKEEFNALKRNNEVLDKNLEECKANI